MAKVTLTYNGTEYALFNGLINFNWKNNIDSKPFENTYSSSDVTFTGWENPFYKLRFYFPNDGTVSPIDGTPLLTWKIWNDIVKHKPVQGTSEVLLKITSGSVGTSTAVDFTSYSSSQDGLTSIPVVVKSFSVAFDAKSSNNAYFWSIEATLIETR